MGGYEQTAHHNGELSMGAQHTTTAFFSWYVLRSYHTSLLLLLLYTALFSHKKERNQQPSFRHGKLIGWRLTSDCWEMSPSIPSSTTLKKKHNHLSIFSHIAPFFLIIIMLIDQPTNRWRPTAPPPPVLTCRPLFSCEESVKCVKV